MNRGSPFFENSTQRVERRPNSSTGTLTAHTAAEKLVNQYTDSVAVYVGECRTAFAVHKHILSTSSIFFQTAFNKQWIESVNRSIPLREATPSAFAIYVHQLYTGKLEIHEDQADEAIQSLDNYTTLLDCYVLGDFLGDSRFSNAVTDEMVHLSKLSKYLPNEHLVEKYWPRLGAAKSGMRRLLVDLIASCDNHEDVRDYFWEFQGKIAETCMRDGRTAMR